ncbi:IS110 family RNA-guided transposase [Helicovermis profundi]|uniref:IS110-like element ISDha10 family transposase n=1 Tax=Helicovermis profundi TaxID=3065157 RepID=A0AAU9E3E2_9FIRM|nr:IS110-like element ISDha10 family transposase [Clostridia bacterium S502]BEP28040.1 IS110-like element ISDha10 family transposase [Clostridia bacterium S502]BEP28166.1 IS110-like element ISDha10 family transposase [Clostridia bacterium S502]BEP28656.1 IS110-like element ISDha10 family transposase [Clostridia bacterium S502]BEP29094.1 IS110-like element ISDha10 family transposase [Clostridia bacterium S502]
MSNYYHLPVVGIDVAANFSVVTALKPNGDVFRKNLKISHTLGGFNKLLLFLQKIEEEFNDSPKVFCESTGIYHLTLLHFLVKNQIDIHVINPLITNSNKNSNIRKVKTDKLDSLSIAKICKFDNVKTSTFTSEEFLHLKLLVREYYKVVDLKANLKKTFSNNIYINYPGLQNAFANITGKTPLIFIRKYPTPKHLLNAEPKVVIELLTKSSRRGSSWANNKYNKLIKIANSANIIGITPLLFESKVIRFSESFDFYTNQLRNIVDEIHQYIDNASFGEVFKQNINLLKSFKGLGDITAITLLVEMGDINNFSKPQQLVAFFGVDPSVNQSGNFSGDRNKMSKRGTAIGRRALYTVALASIRTSKNKKPINLVLYEYYHIALDKKKKKVKLVAVMNKLLRYIFSILKNQKPYEVRNPLVHKRMFLESKLHNPVAA